MSTQAHEAEEDKDQNRTNSIPYLKVLIQEVEEQQNGDQEGQGKGGRDPNQNDGGCELQATAEEEGCKICQVFVHI